jgi:hypothetical protein
MNQDAKKTALRMILYGIYVLPPVTGAAMSPPRRSTG